MLRPPGSLKRLALCILIAIGCASAQPAFEAASIKVNKTDSGPSGISSTTPGRFVVNRTPLKFLILYAYRLLDHQLIGLPGWTEDTTFDITAVYEPGVAVKEADVRVMAQRLLKDRFGLTIHPERRAIPSYDLRLAHSNGKLGPNIAVSSIDCEKMITEHAPMAKAGGKSAVTPDGIRPACRVLATRRYLTGGGLTMPQFITALQSMVARPVIDRTGLTNRYDIELAWTLMDDAVSAAQNDSPSIFTALEEQTGFKLETRKEPLDVIVIDRVTMPTDN